MARLKGLLKIEGTLDQLTFYKTKDGHLVKTKSSIAADRIANDANFQRTRENGSEFGNAATAGKLVRDALRNLLATASDYRVTSRLTQLMRSIIDYDTTSARGSRNVGVAIANASAKALLKGFDFNINAILGAILFKPYTLTAATGVVNIAGFVPLNDIAVPTGATHVSLVSAWAKVDFTAGTYEVQQSNIVNLPIDATSTAVVLTPAAVPTGTGINLFVLEIEFFQQVNNVQYSLKNGAYNAMNIIEVS